MTTIINANTSAGLVSTADTSGIVKLQSNGVTTNALAWGSYAYVGSGSTPTLRSAYNISSITRTGTGAYSFAFTTNLSDANYGVCLTGNQGVNATASSIGTPQTKTTSGFTVQMGYGTFTAFDYGVDFAIFGN